MGEGSKSNMRAFCKSKEVIHSPGLPLLDERRHSGAMDNFQHP